MDFSKMSDADLQALYGQTSKAPSQGMAPMAPQGPQGAPPVPGNPFASMSDEDLKNALAASQGPQGQAPEQPGNPLAAVVSGIANAGANAFEGGVDALTWAGEKLGAISPKIAEQMKKDVAADTDRWFRSSEKTPAGDIFEQSREKYPALSAVPQAVTEVGLLSKLNPSIKGAGTVANTALQSGVGALAGAGLAGPNTQDQTNAAIMGAAIPPVLGALGAGVKAVASKIAGKAGLQESLRETVAAVNKDLMANNQMNVTEKAAASVTNLADQAKKIENQNYSAIKNIPGTINAMPINESIAKVGKNRLSDIQSNILDDIAASAREATTMDDAIKLKQMVAAQGKSFRPGEASDSTVTAYKALKTGIDEAIAAKADAAGMKGAWETANKYHRDVMVPLSDSGAFEIGAAYSNRTNNPQAYADAVKGLLSGAKKSPEQMKAVLNMMDSDGSKIIEQDIVKSMLDDVVVNPEAFDKNATLRTLNRTINKFDGTLSNDSINALKGIKTVLEKGGASSAKQTITSPVTSAITRTAAGSAGGAVIGSVLGGPIGTALGAAVGSAAISPMLNTLSKMASSPQGLAILRGIGEGKPWAKNVANVIRGTALEAAGKLNKSE